MDAPITSSELRCTQCGGELHPDEGQIFLTCPYCGAAVYLDKSKVVFHWYLASTLDEAKARAALARWMAGNQTVKDLDQKATVQSVAFTFFPFWYFKARRTDGQEDLFLEPAAATSVSELRKMELTAGDLRKYEASMDAQSTTPDVPLQVAEGWLTQRQASAGEIVERSLVHLPLYTCKYTYKGSLYTAVVEGGTGEVFANIYPAKAEAPYLLAGGVTAAVFLCLALFPVAGAAAGRNGAGTGLLLCAGLGLIAAPILFALAVWVAAKI
jgi:DNA-directed RNA polymerase subunit RPC12/RpoP